jgi:hypothetical protein
VVSDFGFEMSVLLAIYSLIPDYGYSFLIGKNADFKHFQA